MNIGEPLFLVATLLFIFGIKRLSKVKTARSGNLLSSLGMLIAIVAVVASPGKESLDNAIPLSWYWVLGGLAAGAVLGIILARVVKMTGMPEMVAMLNGFGGAASLLVALSTFWGGYLHNKKEAIGALMESKAVNQLAPSTVEGHMLSVLGSPVWMVAILASVLVGGITLTGSLIATGKLSEKITGAPILLPGRHFIVGFLSRAGN